jgi:succinate-acetate transporter protein
VSVDANTRVVLRPIGNPLPLGFLALAGGSIVVSGLQLGWLEPADGHDVALILLAFVVPLQLLASVFGYLGRDVVAGTAMGLLAGIWLSIALITLGAQPGSTSDALGLFLLLAAVAMSVPAAAATTGKLVLAAVLTGAGLRFAATGLYEVTASGTWKDVAGVIGVVLCALGIYAALAMTLEDARRKTVLPLGRRKLGRTSMEGTFAGQVAGLEREAGVREQL